VWFGLRCSRRWSLPTGQLVSRFRRKSELKMATSTNAELLELAGPRHPYQAGPLGVIEAGAYADLILVDGNPLEDINLVADPGKNFDLIMKDGKIFKNEL
jgi:imidazolonepropionase-like amidohydrolase